jgi:hypothetical protein
MRYIRCIIRSGIFDKVWKHLLILVVEGLETVATLKKMCYHTNVTEAKETEKEKESLPKLQKYINKVTSNTSGPFMK